MLTLDTNYISGSYAQELMQLLMQEENSVLANPQSHTQAEISVALRPSYDGGASIAIGYGIDLLKNSVDTINHWLSSVDPKLTLSPTKNTRGQTRFSLNRSMP